MVTIIEHVSALKECMYVHCLENMLTVPASVGLQVSLYSVRYLCRYI